MSHPRRLRCGLPAVVAPGHRAVFNVEISCQCQGLQGVGVELANFSVQLLEHNKIQIPIEGGDEAAYANTREVQALCRSGVLYSQQSDNASKITLVSNPIDPHVGSFDSVIISRQYYFCFDIRLKAGDELARVRRRCFVTVRSPHQMCDSRSSQTATASDQLPKYTEAQLPPPYCGVNASAVC